jgi:hypothetical protein
MSRFSDAQLDDIKARNPCDQVAAQWVTLRRHGKKMMGPCPLHSPDPHAKDSTGFECDAEGWVCACCSDGGDVIKLMMKREGIEFTAAVERLGGAREIDPVEDAKAEAARAVRKIEREAEHNTWRDRERGRAWDLLKYTRPIGGTLAERYLREIRGLDVPADVQLWFDPAARLYVEDRPKFRLVHSGPAMLAKIQRDGRFAGVHTTWLDLARPKGKARIVDSKSGAELPSKKVRGSKKGGHIDLTGCKDDPRELVLGEGIEKVLAIWTAYAASGRDLTHTAFWTSVDLGNLAGKASSSVPHPSMKTDKGRVPRVPGPDPNLDSPAIAIPDTVERLVLLGDSTSDPFTTQCVMARAAKRYAREGRTVVCAWAPAANDFDDLLREAKAE